MQLNVRISTETDAPHLKEWLSDPHILRWFPMHNEREIDDSIRIWLGHAKEKAAFTIDADGQPVGMAVLYLQPFQKLAHQCLFAIIVSPTHRGQGVGTALYTHLENDARSRGISLLHLEVYEGNPAEALYRRLGFTEYGRQPRFLKEPDGTYINKILMQKRL